LATESASLFPLCAATPPVKATTGSVKYANHKFADLTEGGKLSL